MVPIHVKEHLFDDTYRSKVIDDKTSWFALMEMLDLIFHHFFFYANNLGRQPTTSQCFQFLTRQMLVLVAAAICCAQSEYATRKIVTFMFSQDQYRGIICHSTVRDCITAEGTALMHDMWRVPSYTPPLPMVFLQDNTRSSIPPRHSTVWVGSSICHSALYTAFLSALRL